MHKLFKSTRCSIERGLRRISEYLALRKIVFINFLFLSVFSVRLLYFSSIFTSEVTLYKLYPNNDIDSTLNKSVLVFGASMKTKVENLSANSLLFYCGFNKFK